MILSDRDIKKALSQKRIVIKPLPDFEQALSACAIDLRLHNDFEVFAHTSIPYFDLKNMSNVQVTQKITIEKDKPFILQPGEFALASTLEWIELPVVRDFLFFYLSIVSKSLVGRPTSQVWGTS